MTVCTTPPAGIKDLSANGYYTDVSNSIIDPIKLAQFNSDSKPFNDFLNNVSKLADLYIVKNDVASAQCAIVWLTKWAKDASLLGKITGKQA